jgi:hypothetical protein
MRPFSAHDILGKEIRKREQPSNAFNTLLENFLDGDNAKKIYSFNIEKEVYTRAVNFCSDVELEEEVNFTIVDFTLALYKDFLSYIRNTNNIHRIYKNLMARDLAPAVINRYNDEATDVDSSDYQNYLYRQYDKTKKYKRVDIKLKKKDARRGECVLWDLEKIYPNHHFILEDILGILVTDFMDEYSKGAIKDPVDLIMSYIDE